MAKKSSQEAINGLQKDDDYIVLNNPLASPKFIRTMGKGQNKKEISINETYTPKVFYEIVSRLKPEHLEGIKRTESVKFDINIKQFLEEIGANTKNYRHLIDSVDALQSTLLKWKEGNETITVAIITKSIHNDKTGKIELYVDSDLAKRVLEVRGKENFSFLKSNVFRLQNAQAIKLYPFFKSWANYGKGYEVELERFKNDFGYSTSGYRFWNNFKQRVLEPATEEINEKTDIIITYELVGENLESQRPRVKGLIFYIKNKEKLKQLATGERHEQPKKPQEEPSHISNLIQKVAPKEPKQKAKPQATAGTPSEAEIQQLGEKLKLNPEQIQTIKDKLRGDYIRVFEVLQGCINELKAGNPIKSNIAYILGSIDSLGVGLFAKEQAKAQKRETERIENEKRTIINQLQKEYTERRNKQFTELYNKAAPEQIEPYYNRFKAETNNFGMNFFIDLKKNQFKDTGIYTIGEELAESKGLGKEYRQAKFRQEVFEKHHLQIGFDTKEEISIISLFEQEQPQDEPQPTEATPTAPSVATTTLPHHQEQEQEEPTPSENFAQNTKEEFKEQTENVETPKSIKSLLNRFFK